MPVSGANDKDEKAVFAQLEIATHVQSARCGNEQERILAQD